MFSTLHHQFNHLCRIVLMTIGLWLLGAPSTTQAQVSSTVLYRVNAGGPGMTAEPLDWMADTDDNPSPFSNYDQTGTLNHPGTVDVSRAELPPDTPPALFVTARYPGDDTVLEWDFPVTVGSAYEVRLYLAETQVSVPGARLFHATIEDRPVMENYDILLAAGGKRIGTVVTHHLHAPDDNLDINFQHGNRNPVIRAIEIIESPAIESAMLHVTPPLVDFRNVDQGTQSINQPVTLMHGGSRNTPPITINELRFSGSAAADFTVLTPLPFTLRPGDRQQIDLYFTPSTVGRRVVTLQIIHDGANVVPTTLEIVGEGVDHTTDPRLSWSPPELTDPITLQIEPGEQIGSWDEIWLDEGRDYIIEMPSVPVERGLTLIGGRHVVMIGGEIRIPWQGDNPGVQERTALRIFDATGTVHIEGLLLHGEDISEGIQLSAPDAVVQLQNIGIFGIHARDQVEFSDNHPDFVQPYGNVAELRIDRLTGTTDYQGFFLHASYNGPANTITLRRVNLIGEETSAYLLWLDTEPDAGPVTLDHVWIDVPPSRSDGIARAVWPDANADDPQRAQIRLDGNGRLYASYAETMLPPVDGRVTAGQPPDGDFVTPGEVGVNYTTPGYRPTTP